ncbi:DUF3019 domain-containing protein [Paraglaciecola hydrolytica]|nr:DUF3019 domain-containing protein [Paraglaciecola hydrolytica]
MRWLHKDVMRFGWQLSLVCLLSFSCLVLADVKQQEVSNLTNTFQIQPTTCVSLHQGQACFVNLTLSWHTANKGNYCLYSSDQTSALKCWMADNQGVMVQEFNTAQSLHFYLKQDKSDDVIAAAELEVSWVYKKQQKSRLSWRLF